ncbi:MAG: hypothetical protein Ct9H300mP11_18000 [Chloroflexota bacterium]|nr:MAG: hypothetical protein Ct9H300mP11_18000 [Chloroflexota bacterium]
MVADGLVAQRTIAEMTMALSSARMSLYDAASRWEGASANEKTAIAARPKYMATVAALEVTAKAIQITGGRKRP